MALVSAATGTCRGGLTSTEPKSSSAVPIRPASCLGKALPIGAGWWRTESDDLHSLCWRESLPAGARAPLLPQLEQHPCHHSCQSCLPLTRDTCSGIPASAQVPCKRRIFTRCPRSQSWFRYANWAACDFSSLPPLPHIWTWLWPSRQPPPHIVASKILSFFLQIFTSILNVFWGPSSSPMESWHNREFTH